MQMKNETAFKMFQRHLVRVEEEQRKQKELEKKQKELEKKQKEDQEQVKAQQSMFQKLCISKSLIQGMLKIPTHESMDKPIKMKIEALKSDREIQNQPTRVKEKTKKKKKVQKVHFEDSVTSDLFVVKDDDNLSRRTDHLKDHVRLKTSKVLLKELALALVVKKPSDPETPKSPRRGTQMKNFSKQVRTNLDWIRFIHERNKNSDFFKNFRKQTMKDYLTTYDHIPIEHRPLFELYRATKGASIIKPRAFLLHGDYDFEERIRRAVDLKYSPLIERDIVCDKNFLDLNKDNIKEGYPNDKEPYKYVNLNKYENDKYLVQYDDLYGAEEKKPVKKIQKYSESEDYFYKRTKILARSPKSRVNYPITNHFDKIKNFDIEMKNLIENNELIQPAEEKKLYRIKSCTKSCSSYNNDPYSSIKDQYNPVRKLNKQRRKVYIENAMKSQEEPLVETRVQTAKEKPIPVDGFGSKTSREISAIKTATSFYKKDSKNITKVDFGDFTKDKFRIRFSAHRSITDDTRTKDTKTTDFFKFDSKSTKFMDKLKNKKNEQRKLYKQIENSRLNNILKEKKFEMIYKVNNFLGPDPEFQGVFVPKVDNQIEADIAFDDETCLEISIKEDNVPIWVHGFLSKKEPQTPQR